MNLKRVAKLFGVGVALAFFVLATGNEGQVGLVQAQDQSVEDFETGDFSRLPWERGGDVPWRISPISHSGAYAAQAGKINHGQRSWLQVRLNVPKDGEISFWFKVSSEKDADFLQFFIDDRLQEKWSGEIDWQKVSFPVKVGSHTFRWQYIKDDSDSTGKDTAWLDDITFPFIIDLHPPVITATPNPAPNRYGWNSGDVTVALRAEDEKGGLGIEAIYYKLNGREFKIGPDQLQFSEKGAVATYNLPLSNEGIYNLEFWAKDKAGNESRHVTLTIRIDKTKPAIRLSPPSEGNYRDSLTFNWSISDELSGLAECWVGVNGNRISTSCSGSHTLGIGSYSVEVKAKDKADNSSETSKRYEITSSTVTLAPGQSIQAAIDAAKPGDVIGLSRGEWRENIVITKSLTLRAKEIKEEPEAVITSAKGDWPVIMIESKEPIEVTIQGLKITGASGGCAELPRICADGISILGKARVVIENNTIRDNSLRGIYMAGSSQATIRNNTISGNREVGINMRDSSQATIENNTISGNGSGIRISDSSQATIRNNTISGNWEGISMAGSSQATIENNTISGNGSGIYMYNSSRATIRNNTIRDNRNNGINMQYFSQATIENNTISGNGLRGIGVFDSSQATIRNNTISGNWEGISMAGSSQATIEGNKILNNKWYGVALLQQPCFITDLKFEGAVRGRNNEISGNKEANVCPETLKFLMTSSGGCYGPKC